MDKENLGPADRIVQTVLAYSDHMVHNRPGMVTRDAGSVVGLKWAPVTHKVEGAEGAEKQKVVYLLNKVGKKTTKTKVGILQANNQIKADNGTIVGDYRPAGYFPEVVAWLYRQVAEVWKLDNEFAARWASYAFKQEHKDLKVILAAFLLVQSRKGDPVREAGKIAFYDDDFRDVGEAMMLLYDKGSKTDLNPKLLLRVHDVLSLPSVMAINREMGFGRSARRPSMKRWEKAVTKWLTYREENPKVLEGLVKAGYRTTVMNLARRVGYKPTTARFFEVLRWKQAQSDDGRRTLAIGQAVAAAETWEGLTEEAICKKIVHEKINYKRVVGLIPKGVGLTRAIVAATIEAGGFSDKDLIIASPTLEELGLLQVQDIRERWERALKSAEDMRAANIAMRMKSKEGKEKLEVASDDALKRNVAEVMKDLRVYFMVDISSSMEGAIEAAKGYVARFLQGFPVEKIHVSIFNTAGREIRIPHASAAGVENAFRGVMAGGGTDYGAGIRILQGYKPLPNEDTLFIFVGDEGHQRPHFSEDVTSSGLNPMAFGLVPVTSPRYGRGTAVRETATRLGIPCFEIDERTFADPYAIPRTIRALVAATPINHVPVNRVAAAPRVTLAEMILKTDLLKKPAWAA